MSAATIVDGPAFRCDSQSLEFNHRDTTQAIDFADRQDNFAFEKILENAEMEWGSAQAPELFTKPFEGERPLLRLNQWHG